MCALALLYSAVSLAQAGPKDYLSLTVSTAPNFTLNSASLLENAQTISNAFKLSIKTNRNSCHIYAAITAGITTTSVTPMATSNLLMQFNSTTCSSLLVGSYTTSQIPMTTSNSLLFYALKDYGIGSDWYYDVDIPAIGYSYDPGTYNYTISFTMTQP